MRVSQSQSLPKGTLAHQRGASPSEAPSAAPLRNSAVAANGAGAGGYSGDSRMHEIVETNRRIEKLVGSGDKPPAAEVDGGGAASGQAPGV